MRPQTTPPEVVGRERAMAAEVVGVAVDSVVFEDGGWDSRVYLVNGGEWVVKFPRPGAAGGYDAEIATLRALADLELPVAVPRVRWVDPAGGFFGYAGVVGRQLVDLADSVGDSARRRIGSVIGAFLRVLHDLRLDVPPVDLQEELAEQLDKYERTTDVLRRTFTATELGVIDAFFRQELPERLTALGQEARCCHGDLGPWNVLVSDDGSVGVIDFGDVGYHDPAIDFSALPEAVCAAALEEYDASATLLEKVALRRLAFPVVDLPFYIGKGDAAGLAAGLEAVRLAFFG